MVAPLEKGTFLAKGKYIIYQRLSNGGYGIVYLAKNDKGQYCAIKEFMPAKMQIERRSQGLRFDSEKSERYFYQNLKGFYLEAETALKFNHPNIIRVYDVFEENGTAYIVMPLEKGLSLYTYVRLREYEKNEPLADKTIQKIASQICSGIEFFHLNHFLHLDIKPGNIWLRPNGDVVILDLGSTRDLKKYDSYAMPAISSGFAAPEMEEYRKHYASRNNTPFNLSIDERTDIYSIGGVISFCLELNVPTHALKRADEFPLSLRRATQHASGLLQIAEKAMALDPIQRYQSVQKMKEDLDNLAFLTEDKGYKNYISEFNYRSNQRLLKKIR